MTKDNAEKLLTAFSLATTAGDTVVADLLESVILEVMVDAYPTLTTISGTRNTLEPPWKVTCGPDTVKLGTTLACTGIDQTSKDDMR